MGAQLIVIFCAPSLSLCDATRTVSDTEMDLFRAVYGLFGNVTQTYIPTETVESLVSFCQAYFNNDEVYIAAASQRGRDSIQTGIAF